MLKRGCDVRNSTREKNSNDKIVPNDVFEPENNGINENDLLSLIALIIAEFILNEDSE